MKKSIFFVIAALLFLILTGCSVAELSKVLFATPNTSIATEMHTPSLSLTSTLMNTPTLTPTVTQTSTLTPTPTPEYPGGALILFTAYKNDLSQDPYCGVADVTGKIYEIKPLENFSFYTLFTNDGSFEPPFYCPPGSNINDWSPSMKQFTFFIYSNIDNGYRLYLGDIVNNSYKLLASFPNSNTKVLPEKPNIQWLGDQTIWYYDKEVGATTFINVESRATTFFEGQVTSASSDGIHFTYLDEGTLYLMSLGGSDPINIDQVVKDQGLTLEEYYKEYLISWSPDGKKFMLVTGDKTENTLSIIDYKGNFLVHVVSENSKYGIDFNWSPLSDMIISKCHITLASQNTCIYNLEGELVKEFSWQPYETSVGNLSADGKYVYSLVSDREPALGVNSFSAKLIRRNIETGESNVLSDSVQDLSWISSESIFEIFENDYVNASEVRESPDRNYFLLNDVGSFFLLDPNGKYKMVFSILCNNISECTDFRLGDLNVVGAAWWEPPVEWKP